MLPISTLAAFQRDPEEDFKEGYTLSVCCGFIYS